MSHVTMEAPTLDLGWRLVCARCGEVEPMDAIAEDRQKVDETIRAFVDLHRDCPPAEK